MATINNSVQPGLVSTNPFLSGAPKTGGTTTVASNYANFNPTPQIGSTGLPGGLATTTGTTSTTPSFNMNSGNSGYVPTPQSNTVSQPTQPVTQQSGTGTAVNPNQGMLDQLAQAKQTLLGMQSKLNTPATTPPPPVATPPPAQTPPPASLGSGGPKAGPDQEYGPTGLIQPKQGYSSSNPATYQGLINQEANTASAPTTQYMNAQGNSGTAQSGLLNMGATSTPEYKAAQAQYNSANENLLKLRDQYATQSGNIAMTPGDLSLANGEQGALYNRFSGQESALTGEMTAAQAAAQVATGQQSAQQQGLTSAGSTANASAGAATSQQSTQQQGLGTAIGATAPVQVPYNNQFVSPQTGQSVGGSTGGFNLQSAAQSYAQKVQNNEMSYNDAVTAMGGYGVAGQQALNTALPSGFNVNQSNSTSGSQSAQTQQQQQYQSASQQAQNLGMQLQQVITQAGINPNDLNSLNSFVQKVASNTSDPNYQTFHNLVNDMANRYAQILTPAGGSVTDKTRDIATSLLDSTQSGSSILQVMHNLDAQAQAVISGTTTAYGTKNNSNTDLNSYSNGTNNTNTTSGSTPAGWF
jgi:enamine deaminase RidA (YjgF/YER057c/UK114 family)